MSILGRMVSGAAGAAGQIANRYIDEEISQQRDAARMELQREYNRLGRQDQAEFDDARAPKLRQQRADDAKAAGKTAREIELEGLNDTTLQGARTAKGDQDASDVTRRTIAHSEAMTPAEVKRIEALTPAEVKRQTLLSEAQARAQAKYREGRPDASAEMLKKMKGIEQILGREMTEQEKMAALGMVKNTRDPELDTETVKEMRIDKDGNTVETSRKQVRRPGGAPGAATPQDPAVQMRARVDAARKDGKTTEAIAELKARGATAQDLLTIGFTGDEIKGTVKPNDKPAAAASPAWRPDPASPAGQRRERQEASIQNQAQQRANDESVAAVRRAAADDEAAQILATGNKSALYHFQQSATFNELSAAVKAQVSAAVNAR